MTRAGVVLSQPPISTQPSAGYERSSSSVSIARKLRYIMVEGFWNGSASAIAGISIGNPPDCHTPRLTSCALAEMRVAGVDVAPGVDDGDHGFPRVIALVVAHLGGARAVIEGLAVAHAVPAVAAQLFGAFSRGHCGGLGFELQFYPDNSRSACCFSQANAISSLLSRCETAAARGGPEMQVTWARRKGFVFAALAALALPVQAQEWPKQRPVQFIVAFGPGSTTDIVARLVAQKLGESLGQSVVVENKPGAGGNIGAQFVKRAAPDGYTVLVISVAYAVNPSLYANAGYDPLKDFAPVILGPSTPNIITVHPSVQANNLKELIALARKEKLAYASSGIGTTTHLSMERIKIATGVDITHVPYQPAQAVTAAVSGQTQISSTSMPPAVPQIKAGKLRPIAVTSAQRSAALPDVPTVNEQGFKDFDDLTWIGFFLPAGTHAEIVNRMNAEINRIVELPDVNDRLPQNGLTSKRNSPAEFAAFIREEIPKWAKAVKDSGAKAD